MRQLITLVCLSVALLALPIAARAQDQIQIFGGYSFLRPPITAEEGFTCPMGVLCIPGPPPPTFVTNRRNLNGWEASGSYRILPFLRIATDFSGHYGPTSSNSSSRTHQYAFLVGPEVALPARVSPFAHALFGGATQTTNFGTLTGNATYNSIFPANAAGFASAIGAGIDVNVVPHISVRLIQFDYLLTRFSSSTQNQPRASAGIVIHF